MVGGKSKVRWETGTGFMNMNQTKKCYEQRIDEFGWIWTKYNSG